MTTFGGRHASDLPASPSGSLGIDTATLPKNSTPKILRTARTQERVFFRARVNKKTARCHASIRAAVQSRAAWQLTLRSIAPVKIALDVAFLMISALVRNELRIKASCCTDKSIFSVAFEARIWLYVGLCCDAGGLGSEPVPAVATHRMFPTRTN
jgi:hypothetical protein